MAEDYIYTSVDNAYVSYIQELLFSVTEEINRIINSKEFDKTKSMLLFIEAINLIRIDDKLFIMIVDKIWDLYQHLHDPKNRDFFLDRFIDCRNFLKFRLKNDKNIDLIDLDENDKK